MYHCVNHCKLYAMHMSPCLLSNCLCELPLRTRSFSFSVFPFRPRDNTNKRAHKTNLLVFDGLTKLSLLANQVISPTINIFGRQNEKLPSPSWYSPSFPFYYLLTPLKRTSQNSLFLPSNCTDITVLECVCLLEEELSTFLSLSSRKLRGRIYRFLW